MQGTANEHGGQAFAWAHTPEERALKLGGTCSGEHGVGLHKMGFLLEEAGTGAVDMMRSIKRALDPHNLLNPGKIFWVSGLSGG